MTEGTPSGQEAPAVPGADGIAAASGPENPLRSRFGIEGSLRAHAARGAVINSAFLVGLSALGLVRGFVLAGFLSRTDYGIWGVIGASLGTLVWLKQVGIGDKYIQQDEEDQEVAFQKAFTLELIFTGGFTIFLSALVPVVALAYGEPRLVAPGLVCMLPLVAMIFQTPLWVYYRRMQFGRQRLLQAIDPVFGLVVAVVLAAAGAGYWALVIGLAAGAWAAAAVAVVLSPVKLRLRYERGTAKSYIAFSGPLLVATLAAIVVAQSAAFTADAHLGLAAVGVLGLAANIIAFTDRVDQIVTGTLYPAICAVRDRTALLYESFVKSNRLALMWAVPFGVALTLFASDLVSFGIGERWRPAVTVLQIYGLLAAVNHVGFNWDAYFRARDDTKPIAVANVAAMVAFLTTGIPLLLLFDLKGFAIGIGVQGLVHLAFRAYFLQRLFDGFSFVRHAGRAFLPTLPAAGVVLLARAVGTADRTAALALAELAAYGIVTAAATWYFESGLLREAFGYLRGRRPAGAAA
jgi:O-antigen/teichoic acid export membrane protein